MPIVKDPSGHFAVSYYFGTMFKRLELIEIRRGPWVDNGLSGDAYARASMFSKIGFELPYG